MRAAFAPGTYQNLKTQWNSYIAFCIFFKLDCFSQDPSVLCLYIQLLSRSMKAQGTIDNYLSGAKTLYRLSGVSTQVFDAIELKLTRKGIARNNPHMAFRAHPVTPDMLFKLFDILNLDEPSEAVFWALFLIAFFTMSRKSNLVFTESTVKSPPRMILRKHVSVLGDGLLLNFIWSKTNQFGNRTHLVPLVAIPGSPLCPVAAYRNMVKLVPASTTDPLFVLKAKNNKLVPVTYFQFQTFFRSLLPMIGLNPAFYSSHSFRRGGATWAFKNNVPGELIKNHGDWASSAYMLYLDLSLEKKFQVSEAMVSAILPAFR